MTHGTEQQLWRSGAHILRCPVCGDEPSATETGLRCPRGHVFDRARQGYVSLLTGRGSGHRSDTAPMVAARRRILDSGMFDAVANALAAAIPRDGGVVVDAGTGTGHYLAAALGAAPAALGVGIDLSKYCARAAAKAHPRALAVVADLWEPLPLGDGIADAVLSVFAPRNAAEVARIVASGGCWLIVTPNPGHLHEVREALGMLDIGADKLVRLHDELAAAGFRVTASEPVTSTSELGATQAADLAGMGPAGFHRGPDELAAAAAALVAGSGAVAATVDVTMTVARR
ncbi:putative RNA methyltransferase [Gordonia sp. PP30]|uniref:putative RNA methyltransferase n=1 Tax=Gordonia sp. PP30 TaxID=2935861 RepID=UPI0032D58646